MSDNHASIDKKRARDDSEDSDIQPHPSKRVCTTNSTNSLAGGKWHLVSLKTGLEFGFVKVVIARGEVTDKTITCPCYSDAFAFLVTHGIYFVSSEIELIKLAKKALSPPDMKGPNLINLSVGVRLQDKTRAPANKVNDQNLYVIRLKGNSNELPEKFPGQGLVEVRFSQILFQGDDLGQFNPDFQKLPEIPAAPSPPSPSPLSTSSMAKKNKWDVLPVGAK